MKRGSMGWFVLYIVFGLYFINYSLDLITMPEFITSINRWIFLIGGILIILGAINHFRANRFKFPY